MDREGKMMEEINYHSRQGGLVTPTQLSIPITIIGAGSIGSWTALALTKMGARQVSIWDHDTIEYQNVGSQVFGDSDIGQLKVDALASTILSLSPIGLFNRHTSQWNATSPLVDDIIISAVDVMAVRKSLYETHKGKKIWFIDGRMAANEINLYAFKLDDIEKCKEYEDTLFTDEEAREIPCSERSVMYNAMTCGGLISSIVARIVNDQPVRFETIVDLRNMIME